MNPPVLYSRKANGKFLLTGEYAVLDGAKSLALPLIRGQWLEVSPSTEQGVLHWTAQEMDQSPWFTASFRTLDFGVIDTNQATVAETLQQILVSIRKYQPKFLSGQGGYIAQTRIDFDRSWGFGTSSTLISLLSDWAAVNPYTILAETMGGSGYDLACAFQKTPIYYTRTMDIGQPIIESAAFAPPFAEHLYFVYLNQKQDSRAAIRHYRAEKSEEGFIQQVSAYSEAFAKCRTLSEFQDLIKGHETLLAERLQMPKVKDLFFQDFPGAVKSLGGWGGDFVLAASPMHKQEMQDWCNSHGFSVFFAYHDLVY